MNGLVKVGNKEVSELTWERRHIGVCIGKEWCVSTTLSRGRGRVETLARFIIDQTLLIGIVTLRFYVERRSSRIYDIWHNDFIFVRNWKIADEKCPIFSMSRWFRCQQSDVGTNSLSNQLSYLSLSIDAVVFAHILPRTRCSTRI